MTKNDVPLRGLLVFTVRPHGLWQMTVTGPEAVENATLYRIAQTWRVE